MSRSPSLEVQRLDLRIDVSRSVPIEAPLELAATLLVPEVVAAEPVVVVMCTPGGSLAKELFDLPLPGYSMLDHIARHGYVAMAVDHLGTGASTRPTDGDAVGLREMAAATAAAARQVRQRVVDGTLIDALAPQREARVVGFGHSLGGYSTIIQQGAYGCYDAIGVLGASNQYLERVFTEPPDRSALSPDELREWVKTVIKSHGNDVFREPYMRVDRAHQDWQWYWDDVPSEIKALDPETVLPRNAAIDGVTPQFTLADAARIDVPVFLAFGERDVSPNPHVEPSTYPSSPDVSLFVLPRSGHLHNVAGTRAVLWNRILSWLSGVTSTHLSGTSDLV